MVSEVKWTTTSEYWMNTHKSIRRNGESKYTVHTRPQNGLDWRWKLTHKWFKDWREEAELLLNTILSHISIQETKLKFVSLWAGKEARTYLNMVDQDKKDSLKTMLDTLKDWTKPKSDEVTVFTQLRRLNQGNKTIYFYPRCEESGSSVQFQLHGRLHGQANQKLHCSGSQQHQAYQQCISECSSLTLNECIKSCQTEDATCIQVQVLHPESTDYADSTSIHKIAQYPQQWVRHNYRGRVAFRGGRHSYRGGLGGAWPQRQDYRHSTETVC